mgnify:CR=1 FL=1
MITMSVRKIETQTPAKKSGISARDRLLALLDRDGGATISEIVEATGWQPHSARAMVSGIRKAGTTVAKEKVGGVTRYSVATATAP